MRTLIATVTLLACSGAWAEEESVELVCTFNDGTESIKNYPLGSHGNKKVEGSSNDHVTHICHKQADVSSNSISIYRTCNWLITCQGMSESSTTFTQRIETISVSRKTGAYSMNWNETHQYCNPMKYPNSKDEGLRTGRCEVASEVENKF